MEVLLSPKQGNHEKVTGNARIFTSKCKIVPENLADLIWIKRFNAG